MKLRLAGQGRRAALRAAPRAHKGGGVHHPGRIVTLIKAVHTLIFVFFTACIGVVVQGALTGNVTRVTWIAWALVLAECVVFVGNGWKCPLTRYTEALGARSGSVADIFLPRAFARRLPVLAGSVYGLATVILVIRALP